ncbi:MAG: acyltransferase, left-handed parallel beta-helix (hexapeptide repeat) family, partial [Verrucomicrobiales bacterium]|nr:acyltransferase, left-handed parallel beta-helix (hexapeptide repeat) family [Verrucomicrobiales bacterium]
HYMIIAVGNCEVRLELAAAAQAHGFHFATAIHPSAIVASDVEIGDGTVIAAGAVVNPGAHIGAQVIVNTSATVAHECVIHDGAHIGPGARMGGNVVIGKGTWVAIGATLIDRIKVGEGVIIGAGAVVTRDITSGVVAYGVPARAIRMNDSRFLSKVEHTSDKRRPSSDDWSPTEDRGSSKELSQILE